MKLSDYCVSEIQNMMRLDIQPKVAPELTFLFPRILTWMEAGGEQWIGIRCHHPRYPVANWLDPPKAYLLVKYRFGQRHQWLMEEKGQAWAIRRAALLIRLLLKRLARDVERAMQ